MPGMLMDQSKTERLVTGILQGDKTAEGELFYYFKDEVEFLVRLKIGKNNPDWEDVRQEIFISFFQRIRDNQYDKNKGTFGAFLQSSIKYKIMDYRKSPQYQRRHEYDDIKDGGMGKNKNNPEEALEDKQEKQLLKQAISQLNEPYKEILFLSIYKQLKVKEISERLNVPEQKVSNLKSYALNLLEIKIKNKI
jgi:RNA polymerase sigma-70 factor (ECF subfamily)